MNFHKFTELDAGGVKKERSTRAVEPRKRGVKPNDPHERTTRVAAAIEELAQTGASFTVADVAQRAGVSRATIYRDHALRLRIGARGDGIRPIDPATHARVCASHQSLKAKARQMRQDLQAAQSARDEMRDRAVRAEQELERTLQRVRALTLQRAAAAKSDPLAEIAGTIGIDGVRLARRRLVRALHPDLFATEPDVAVIATALLRLLNELAD